MTALCRNMALSLEHVEKRQKLFTITFNCHVRLFVCNNTMVNNNNGQRMEKRFPNIEASYKNID
jgi:hypothetical protein